MGTNLASYKPTDTLKVSNHFTIYPEGVLNICTTEIHPIVVISFKTTNVSLADGVTETSGNQQSLGFIIRRQGCTGNKILLWAYLLGTAQAWGLGSVRVDYMYNGQRGSAE